MTGMEVVVDYAEVLFGVESERALNQMAKQFIATKPPRSPQKVVKSKGPKNGLNSG